MFRQPQIILCYFYMNTQYLKIKIRISTFIRKKNGVNSFFSFLVIGSWIQPVFTKNASLTLKTLDNCSFVKEKQPGRKMGTSDSYCQDEKIMKTIFFNVFCCYFIQHALCSLTSVYRTIEKQQVHSDSLMLQGSRKQKQILSPVDLLTFVYKQPLHKLPLI